MQNRPFKLRSTQFRVAIAAVLLQSVACSANAASSMSDPISAAIAAAGRKPASHSATESAPQQQARPVTSRQEAAPPASTPAAQPSGASAVAPAVVSAAASATTAAAADAATSPRHTEASELAALQSQIALWKARAEIAKYKAEVKRAEESLLSASQGAAPAGAAPAISLSGPVPTAGVAERMPRQAGDAHRLVSLRAFDGQFNAVVDVNGRTVPVVAGDALDGGWKVVSIDDGGVKIANGKRVRTLRP
ncbi:type IV pilus biogenesis protein PilP [Cupriavidus sp. H39]|uniref:type IV pilus biogenesis protein PilP n=1 Tax=Cupriavidus sp. H39 TaxID=3401635 RepID=UPI003D022C8B